MKKKNIVESKDARLREMYEDGKISAEEFIERLFSSKEADRRRQNIVKKKERILQRA